MLALFGLSTPATAQGVTPGGQNPVILEGDTVGYFRYYDAWTFDSLCISSGTSEFIFIANDSTVDSVRFLPTYTNNVFRQLIITNGTNDTSWYRVCVQILQTDSVVFKTVCDTMAVPTCILLPLDQLSTDATFNRKKGQVQFSAAMSNPVGIINLESSVTHPDGRVETLLFSETSGDFNSDYVWWGEGSFYPSTPGSYLINTVVYDADGIAGTETVEVYLSEDQLPEHLLVMSLAGNGFFVRGAFSEPATVTIINQSGQSEPWPAQVTKSGAYMLDLPSGIYTIKVETSKVKGVGTVMIF